mgnify:CR=1 FL=1
MQAAEAKKVYAIAYHSDMSKYGPNAQLTAVTHHWGALLHEGGAGRSIDGKWKPGNVVGRHQGRHDQNGTSLKPRWFPGEVQDHEQQDRGRHRAGRPHPFTGPVRG